MTMTNRTQQGIGILSAVVLLAVIAVSIVLAAPMVYQVIAADNTTKTSNNLQNLKIAITGNPHLLNNGGRVDFGYIGTVGNVPSQLSDLWLAGSKRTYSFDSVKRVGAGWIGPYLPNVFANDLLAMDSDLFSRPLIYTSTAFTRPSDNQVIAARILSAGADGVTGTGDDMYIDILKGEVFATVTGTLYRQAVTVAGATVTLNLPVNGAVGTQNVTTDSNGVFTFTNVPFGFRSLSISPLMTYSSGSASTTGGGNPKSSIKFVMTNYAANSVAVSSITATYNRTMYFESVQFGNTTVWNFNNGTRAASGQTLLFSSSQTVGGSGKPTQVVPIRVDQQNVTTPNVFIRGVGSSVTVTLNNFNTVQTGTGTAISPSGATFTINFSDGSSNTFTVP
jgi:hypothetical protein